MPQNEVGIEIRGTLAIVTIDCGGASNYLNEHVISELASCMATLAEMPGIKAICLSGRPDSFAVGAEVSMFLRSIEAGDVNPILSFTRKARDLLSHISQSHQVVFAWVNGAAIGGGLELALSCQRIVASPTARFALPETGLGIYPGMGGTQRLPRRIGTGLAKWMIYTGAIVPAAHALAIGLVDAVHPTATTAEEALTALEQPVDVTQADSRFAILEELFGKHSLAELLDASRPMPSYALAVRALVQLRGKAPIALRLAETIIDRGATMSLAESLDEEFAHLAEIFATEDARIGLASVGKERPQFVGR